MKPVLTCEVTGDELKSMGCGVIVEMWNKKSFGKGKRAWEAENFTPGEKVAAGDWHRTAYSWEMRRGYPQTFQFKSAKDYLFLQRLCNFFGIL